MNATKQRQIKTVKCPYMPQHIMPEGSLLNHLSKCSATNKHLFTKCKYNPIHVYPNHMIEEHYKKCKSKARFQKNEESSDDWDVDDQDAGKQENKNTQANQSNVLNQSIGVNQSSITLKSDPDEEEWIKMSSDEEDFEETQQKLQNMSIASKKTEKSKMPESSIESFTLSEATEWKSTKNNTSKIESKNDKQNQSISRQIKKESPLNHSDKFVYEESEPEQRTKPKKKGNETLQSITESEKSRDNNFKISEKKKAPTKQVDDDFDVQDF